MELLKKIILLKLEFGLTYKNIVRYKIGFEIRNCKYINVRHTKPLLLIHTQKKIHFHLIFEFFKNDKKYVNFIRGDSKKVVRANG